QQRTLSRSRQRRSQQGTRVRAQPVATRVRGRRAATPELAQPVATRVRRATPELAQREETLERRVDHLLLVPALAAQVARFRTSPLRPRVPQVAQRASAEPGVRRW